MLRFVGIVANLLDPLELNFYEAIPKVSGVAAWSENCKWYGSLPLGVSLVSFAAITLCVLLNECLLL
jgi:hypothetical protein